MEEIFPDERMNMPKLTLLEYLPLVDYMGRKKKDRQGAIPPELPPILERFRLSAQHLPDWIDRFGRIYPSLIGSPEALKRESEASGQVHLSRSAASSLLYLPPF